ncbi:MAG: nucleotidyltransferase family protein [Candidatus Omnitrophica bacterium]|nr:nucleotidyltransferase family protein [Candidatus Omnitrophota bacterium]
MIEFQESAIGLFLRLSENFIYEKSQCLSGYFQDKTIDWKCFKEAAVFHELAPFFYPEVKDDAVGIPPGILEFLKRAHYYTFVRSQKKWREFLTIAEAFGRKGLSLTPLKGLAGLADIYRERPFRVMSDIDILIREEEIKAAKEVLAGLGYQSTLGGLKEKYWLERHCELTFYKEGGPPLDVHFRLDFKRPGREILPHLWERVRTVSIEGRDLRLLSPEDQLFSLALHERRYGGKMFCLKNVFDLALILKKCGERFDWDYVLREARAGKMRATVFFIVLRARIFFDAAVPESVWTRLRISGAKKRAMTDLANAQTFNPESEDQSKELFLKSHFLLFDGFWEPISYILNIPIEQFAKYYDLEPYANRTRWLYNLRFFYSPWRWIFGAKATGPKNPERRRSWR